MTAVLAILIVVAYLVGAVIVFIEVTARSEAGHPGGIDGEEERIITAGGWIIVLPALGALHLTKRAIARRVRKLGGGE